MSNFDHVSDLVAAREKIQNLIERLDAAKADVDKWKMTFDVTVQPANNALNLLVTARVGDRGFSFAVGHQEILNFNGDFQSLSNIVAEKALQFLLKEQVEQELAPEFVQACRNIAQLTSRSSL
jgi:hypothetical protein